MSRQGSLAGWKADRLDRLEKLKGSFAVVLVRCLQRCFDIRVRYTAAARLSPQKLNRSASGDYKVEKLSTLPLSDDKKFILYGPAANQCIMRERPRKYLVEDCGRQKEARKSY